ncbi:MAG TPA: hypothetical protein ENL03_04015 [Phycisphaerae bacterium]|nr:hypothetical protein [Phycisphaerae bacterium]
MGETWHDTVIRLLKWFVLVSLAGIAALGVWVILDWDPHSIRVQLLLSLLCVFFGAMFMRVQLNARRQFGIERISKLLTVGALIVLISQICFLLLVWTDWKISSFIWRAWWLAMIPSVVVTHLLLLRGTGGGEYGLVGKGAGFCAIWAGIMLLIPACMPHIFTIPTWCLYVGAVPAAGTIFFSMVLAVKWILSLGGPRVVAKPAAVSVVVLSHLILAAGAFYVGRHTSKKETPQEVVIEAANAGETIKADAEESRYNIISTLARLFGGTRLVKRTNYISREQVENINELLQPGDIFLTRKNGYLSNAALPGFWSHSALYVGDNDDLEKLSIADHPAIKKHTADSDGTIIEGVGDGVLFRSHIITAMSDYCVVLRPRLSDADKAKAIVRAFGHVGKEYDFDFDFTDSTKLVCSELIYDAFGGLVEFKLVDVMGADRLPCDEIVKMYIRKAGQADRQLDFVLFFDADVKAGKANLVTEEDFRQTVNRPGFLVE